MSVSRVLVVPRWAGTPDSDWYTWLARSFARSPSVAHGNRRPSSVARGGQMGAPALEVLSMPDPELPIIARWTAALRRALDYDDPASTVLVGHSVGAQTVLRVLATSRPKEAVAGVLLVAPWWSIDVPWDSIRPWLDDSFDHTRARAATRHTRVLLSTDDPFTKDQGASQKLFEDRLGAQVEVHTGLKHFNRKEEPVVLKSLRDLIDQCDGDRQKSRRDAP